MNSPAEQQAANIWMAKLDTSIANYRQRFPASAPYQRWQQLALMMIAYDAMLLEKSRQLNTYLDTRLAINPSFAQEPFVDGHTGKQARDYNADCLSALGVIWMRWNSPDWPITLRDATRVAWINLHPPVPHIGWWLSGLLLAIGICLAASRQQPMTVACDIIDGLAHKHRIAVGELRNHLPRRSYRRLLLLGFNGQFYWDLRDIAERLAINRVQSSAATQQQLAAKREQLLGTFQNLGCTWPAWQEAWRRLRLSIRNATSLAELDELAVTIQTTLETYHRQEPYWQRARTAWNQFPHDDPEAPTGEALWNKMKDAVAISPSDLERLEHMSYHAVQVQDQRTRRALQDEIVELMVAAGIKDGLATLVTSDVSELRRIRNDLAQQMQATATAVAVKAPHATDPTHALWLHLNTAQRTRLSEDELRAQLRSEHISGLNALACANRHLFNGLLDRPLHSLRDLLRHNTALANALTTKDWARLGTLLK